MFKKHHKTTAFRGNKQLLGRKFNAILEHPEPKPTVAAQTRLAVMPLTAPAPAPQPDSVTPSPAPSSPTHNFPGNRHGGENRAPARHTACTLFGSTLLHFPDRFSDP